MLWLYLIACLVTYLYGSIPFSLLIGFLYGVDLRLVDSGNIGARNLGRNCGTLAFFLGFFLDGSKGVFAFVLALFLGLNPLVLVIFAILGHCFSCFINFKGGKGVSTGIIFSLLYAPVPTIVALIVFTICIKITHYLSISAVIATLAFVIVGLFVFSNVNIVISFIVLILVIFVYRKSFRRIINGTEEKSNFI